MKFYEKYMNFIGPLGNIMFYLQAYKIFATKSAHDISGIGFGISLVGLSSWLLYGLLLKNQPLILANLVGVIGVILTIIGTLIYG